MIYKRKQ
jgi:hypothetical protein